jgi:Co/Zn/Cd efflux system component
MAADMVVFSEWLRAAAATAESRRGCVFGVAFLILGCISFVASQLSSALVLQLNAFQLIYRGICTLSQFGCREFSRRRAESSVLSSYPFGLVRLDHLFQFAAATMLAFASLSVMVEGLHHLLESHDTEPVLVEVVCSAHLACIVLFCVTCRPEVRFFRSSTWSLVRFLIFESRAPLICFISCVNVTYFGAPRIDVACALIYAATCLFVAVAHVRSVAPILLQEAPADDVSTTDAMRQIALVEGVSHVRQWQTWCLTHDVTVAAVKVEVKATCDKERTLRRVRAIVSQIAVRSTIEVESGGSGLVLCHDPLPQFPAPPVQLHFPVYV